MFEAVPRLKIIGAEAMTKAAQIVAGVNSGDPERSNMYAGDWDPDVISAEDKKAFLEQLVTAQS